MTKKARLQLLSRFQEARRRLRDAAAGDLASAEAEAADADERRSDAAAGLHEVKEGVGARLAEAQTVRALWTFEREHRLAQGVLREAEVEAEKARTESERHRAYLIVRVRELKTTEKVIDRTRAGLHKDEQRAEQRSSDDMASRTRRDDE